MSTATEPLQEQTPLKGVVPQLQALNLQQTREDLTTGLQDIANGNTEPEEEITPEPEVQPKLGEVIPPNEEPEVTEPAKENPKSDQIDTGLGNVELKKKTDVAPPAEEAEEPLEELPPSQKKAHAEFTRLQKENRALKKDQKDAAALREEIETLKKTPAQVNVEELPEVKTLKQQTEALQKQLDEKDEYIRRSDATLKVVSVEKSKEYQEGVIKPWQAIQETAAAIARKKEINPHDILAVIQNQDPEAQEALFNNLVTTYELSTFDQGRIIEQIRDYKTLSSLATELKSNADTTNKLIEENRKREFEGGKQEYLKALQKARGPFREQYETTRFPNAKDDAELASALKQANDLIDKADWYQIPVDQQARILESAVKDNIYITLLERKYEKDTTEAKEKITKLEAQVKDQEEALKKFGKATPSAGSSSSSPQKAESAVIGKDEKFGVGEAMNDFR